MRQQLLDKANDLLNKHESAPSAVNLVMAHLLTEDVPDSFVKMVYNCGSEGQNDTLRELLLEYMTDDQLSFLIKDIEDWAAMG